MKVLVTGTAGFIGFHVAKHLLARGDEVIGVDSINDYYDVRLKHARLEQLKGTRGFDFTKLDIADDAAMVRLFRDHSPARVVHLAAQAGVRYSLTNPHAYIDSNIRGFINILEGCRHTAVEHLVFASSSSVYGANTQMPFSVHHSVDHPVSLYAATKKANELMAHTYSHLYRFPATGLRFFTVYGPWGRPDMAIFRFVEAILAGRPIEVYNNGDMSRDFTYIDDIVEGVVRVLDRAPSPNENWSGDAPDPGSSRAPYRVYNIGNASPVGLTRMIDILEECLGRTATRKLLPMQPGDVPATSADVTDLQTDTGFRPTTSIEVGLRRFVDWYCAYNGVEQVHRGDAIGAGPTDYRSPVPPTFGQGAPQPQPPSPP
jgi:UDP-glucuronate 4-epimerase